MVKTTNGFEIAELDLRLRGPGEFFGTRQAGMPDFRVANLLRDRELLELAKREAAWVTAGPHPEGSTGAAPVDLTVRLAADDAAGLGVATQWR